MDGPFKSPNMNKDKQIIKNHKKVNKLLIS